MTSIAARSDLAKAEEQYNIILSKDPNSAEAYYRLGLIYQAMGDPSRPVPNGARQ